MNGLSGLGLGILPFGALGFGCILPVALSNRGGGVAAAGCLGVLLYLVIEVAIVFTGAAKLFEGAYPY